MIQATLLGITLGFVAGMVPGPFTTLIVATSLRDGFWGGVWIAVVPLITETAVLGVTALVLSQLPNAALRWMGLAGGIVLLYIAWRTWREARDLRERSVEPLTGPPRRRIFEGALFALLSPTPWVFWLLLGSPLFLGYWREAWPSGVAFVGAFLGSLVGVHLLIAGAAGYGQKRLPKVWRRRLMLGAAVALVVLGAGLAWQSAAGNFERMIQGPQEIRDAVEEVSRAERPGTDGEARTSGVANERTADSLTDAAGEIVAFLRGAAPLDAEILADSVWFRVAAEGGGAVRVVARDALRDRDEWRVAGFVLVPPASLTELTFHPGSHVNCGETSLDSRFPDIGDPAHVGVRAAAPGNPSCLSTWNATFAFDDAASSPRLVGVAYDQWEW